MIFHFINSIILTNFRSYICLGDSAYELSRNLLTPYSETACNEERLRRKFNSHHAAARTGQ